MEDDDLQEGPLASIYETQAGHSLHEWIVTAGDTAEDSWGEGYVIRTIEPCLVFKWGYTSEEENRNMSGGLEFDDGQFLSVLLLNMVKSEETSSDEIQSLIPSAVLAAAQKAESLAEDNDAYTNLVDSLMTIEQEEGVEKLKNVLAQGLATTCARISGKGKSKISVEEEFVTAELTIKVKKLRDDS
ncbi:MAG: hypothetical protein MI867_22095 [Pseudomonadales bacterium]|nr:hypothetical protein [Pseudomonadales bacterium]